MADSAIGLWGIPLAVLGGAVRVSTPFLFVSLGECITERSGRINLGLEGTLVMGAMGAYGVSYLTGSPWLGVLAAGVLGALLGALHAAICGLPRVNDIAVGIALMLFGTGLAFYLGKPLIEPSAAMLPSINLGWWSDAPPVRAALQVNVLFLIGAVLAPVLVWALNSTRWGLILRTVGESADAARAMGYSVNAVRLRATMAGGFLAGIGGFFLVPGLSGKLERRPVERPGHHRGGPRNLRALEPHAVLLGIAAVRCRRSTRAGAAIGRHQPGLLPLQRGALHPDPADHDRHLLAEAHAYRRAGRVERHQVAVPASTWKEAALGEIYMQADPYPWPYDGDVRPQNTALIIVAMQTDFCGIGGHVDRTGYDLPLTRAPIEPIRSVLAAVRERGFHVFHTREGERPDLADLPENKRWRSRRIGAGIGDPGREANDRGFECLLLEDCCGATDRGNHEHAAKMIKMQDAVFGAVSAAATFTGTIA